MGKDKDNNDKPNVTMSATDRSGRTHTKTGRAGGDGTVEVHRGTTPGVHQAGGDQVFYND
ncbi:hypothetical protein RB614_09070 [Phytohabitans sp. ZYX-F-186]|uniref:Uncharacterized protein n=1 Tax=Phytohabitans maris TaxID=3071409 RepID=A0ABU0ZEC8_9ACTN|nr:hypothetical protein [Phytohabitans sp. ZYX-F-186]MDQ7904670.1 hypothetical protein [Phytohabitans sp. ZYX-F-186]